MIPANGSTITIAGNDDDMKFGIGHLDPRSLCQGTSVIRMETTEIEISVCPARTADAGYYDDLILINARFFNGPDEGIGHNAISTAGTPDMGQLVLPQKSIIYMHTRHVISPPSVLQESYRPTI